MKSVKVIINASMNASFTVLKYAKTMAESKEEKTNISQAIYIKSLIGGNYKMVKLIKTELLLELQKANLSMPGLAVELAIEQELQFRKKKRPPKKGG